MRGGQEQAVRDLAVGQPACGKDGDLALLRGELVEQARGDRQDLRGHTAGAPFGFRAPRPRRRAEAAERFESGLEDGFGVLDPPLPSQPFPVVQLKLSPLERPRAPRGIGQGSGKMRLGVGGLGEEAAGAARELFQPGSWRGVQAGQRLFQ